ncbi:hypothetical protein ABZW30_44770 [Kitasatospora sp. NPDC004669]|uniref:hypothetical protein n=1 Tax=Kitasatospora sp. NPDC004669 TaxID=3154555 RepID=UPI0033BEADA2
MSDKTVIELVLVDAENGKPFARSEMPVNQLPETFAHATRLDLGGQGWEVVDAQPAEVQEFRATGRLVLTLRRVHQVDPRTIGYTLPSILEELPPLAPADPTADDLVIHEDDWRQTELVERGCAGSVADELEQIRRIYRHHSQSLGEGESAFLGFTRLHPRRGPELPLPSGTLTQQRLFELLPVSRRYDGVALRDAQGRIVGSFAARVGEITVYGCTDPSGRVTALGLTPAVPGPDAVPGLTAVLREFDLLLVDWCATRCEDATGPAL